jgi:MinD-like ATPase involved in chromosome partitioning or flagellar assembly
MSTITVLAAVRGAAETQVVIVLGAPGSDVTVTRRCGDVIELLAAAAAGAGMVAVVSGDLPGLDRDVVARLHGSGVQVVALSDGSDDDRLRALGIDIVVRSRIALDPGEVLLEAVHQLGSAARPASYRPPESRARATRGPRGRVIAVWGPVGSPGRTAVALELAAVLAGIAVRRPRRGALQVAIHDPQPCLLIDADTYGSSLMMRLGVLDDGPGLAAACRAAAQGSLGLADLARLSPAVAPGLRVLSGLIRPNRWPELPASSLEVVFDRARDLTPWTIIDTAPAIEADEVLMYDTHAPQRNAATLTSLAACDDLVVVGSADPIGIQRLIRALDDLREIPVSVTAPAIVVVNRVRPSTVGRRPEAAVRDAMARFAGVEDPIIIPEDPDAFDAALLAGRTLAEHAPNSPALSAIVVLAERLAARAAMRSELV